MKVLFIALLTSLAPLLAQTTTLVNTSNGVLGMDFVVGDNFAVTITDAAVNKTVTMVVITDGVPSSPWVAGTTDGQGGFTTSGTQSAQYIGEWKEQWRVDGVDVGPLLDFEVIDRPVSLKATSATVVTWTQSCGATYLGVFGDIGYQIYGQTGSKMSTNWVYLEPHESLWDARGVFVKSGDIGPVAGFPDSSDHATAEGTFQDVPFGACATPPAPPFSNVSIGHQEIEIYVGSNAYTVRTNYWYVSSTGVGHGSLTNNNDVSFSR